MEIEELGSEEEHEANEAAEEEAQTPDETDSDDQEGTADEAEAEEAEAQSAEDTDTETEEEKKKLSPSQARRQRRREARERHRLELEETQRRAREAEERLAQYEDVDPNTADDYDTAIQQNAVNRALRTQGQREAEALKKEADNRTAQVRETKLKEFREDARELAHITDFEDKVFNDTSVPFTPDMVEAILDMERGPEVAYHLATNTDELRDIAQLPPMQKAMALGKLEATLPAVPKPKRISSAQEPLKKLSGNGAKLEPNPDKMSYQEYRAHRGMNPEGPGYRE
jgi:hypothetical protein